MRIERNDGAVSWPQVAELYRAVGWGERDPDEVRAAFARSTFKSFALRSEWEARPSGR